MDGDRAAEPWRVLPVPSERFSDAQARCESADLDPYELRLLTWLSHGLSCKDIARESRLSHDAVMYQARKARGKLGAKSTTHAVAIVLRAGLIT